MRDNSEQEQGERNHREQDQLARLEAELNAQPEGDNTEADMYDPCDSWHRLEAKSGINIAILKARPIGQRVERVRGIQI